MLFGSQSTIWNRDIDRLAPAWVLTGLSHATGTPLPQVEQTTLPALAGLLSESVPPNGHAAWIVPLSLFHRCRRRPGLMYCPACLAEEQGQYYRRLWRLAWATVCVKHDCLLQDTCPACGAPIAPHRNDMIGRALIPSAATRVTCPTCQHPLTKQSLVPANHELIELQILLEDTLAQGFIDWTDNPNLHSVLFFEGLRALLSGGLRAMRRRDPTLLGRAPIFERRPLAERREGMLLLGHWLDRWPQTFLTDVARNEFRCSELAHWSRPLPYWCGQVLYPLNQKPAKTSELEAQTIMHSVLKCKGKYSLPAARQLAGKDISKTWLRLHPRRKLTYETLETAVVTVDHQIAGTLDPAERLKLLRTKFMLVGRYGLRLRPSALASLTLAGIYRLGLTIPIVSFYEVPHTREQAAAWSLWYWYHIRPLTKPAKGEKRVFTALRAGRGLSPSSCSLWTQLPASPPLDGSDLPQTEVQSQP